MNQNQIQSKPEMPEEETPPPIAATANLRMSAYYYSFNETGVAAIDRILSAVACAGKAFHHTECWYDESMPYPGHEGGSPVEWIQNAANDAAKSLQANAESIHPKSK